MKVNGYEFSDPKEVEVFCALLLCLNINKKNNLFNTGLCTYTERSNSVGGPRAVKSYSCLGRYISFTEDNDGLETSSQMFCCPLATYCSEQNRLGVKNTTYASPLWCSDSQSACRGSILGCCWNDGCFISFLCTGKFSVPQRMKTCLNHELGTNNNDQTCCITPLCCIQDDNCWASPWLGSCASDNFCCTPLCGAYGNSNPQDSLCCCLGMIFISQHLSQWCGVLWAEDKAGLDGDFFPGLLCTNNQNFCCLCECCSLGLGLRAKKKDPLYRITACQRPIPIFAQTLESLQEGPLRRLVECCWVND